MKPSSALILNQDGIVLLQRSARGWQVIGHADPAANDLTDRMHVLRDTAKDLSGGQFATKLVIPNAQILYRRLEIGLVGATDKQPAVRAALDGLTPYDVDELAFDWRDAGDAHVDVAAVAEQTLAEAEEFAEKHRFNPISFVAIPEPDTFQGEPFFGETSIAHRLLNPGGHVEPDSEPIDFDAVLASLDAPIPLDRGAPEDVRPDGDGDGEDANVAFHTTRAADGPRPEEPEAEIAFHSARADEHATDEGKSETLNLKWVTPRLSAESVTPVGETVEMWRNAQVSQAGVTAPVIPVDPEPVPEETAPAPANKTPDLVAVRRQVPAARRPEKGAVLIGLAAAAIVAGLAVAGYLLMRPDAAPDVELAAQLPRPAAPEAEIAELEPAARPVAPGPAEAEEPDPEPADEAPAPPLSDVPPAIPDLALSLAEPVIAPSSDPAAQPAPDAGARRGELPARLALIDPLPGRLPAHTRDFAAPLPPDLDPVDLARVMLTAPLAPGRPATDRIDGLYLASIDRFVLGHDAVALPAIAGAMPDPSVRLPGSAADGAVDRFDFGATGLVAATPEGALTPQGILVYAGAPPVRPLARPFEPVPQPADGLDPARRAELAAFRPLPRPVNLQETGERAQFAGLSRNELAAFRPMPRPRALQARGEAQASAPPPTRQAVLASIRPIARPKGLGVRPAAPQRQVAAVPTAPRTTAPPSGASVAQAATIKDGLEFARVNLIGVYGNSSSRRALVRLNGGRFVMVSVGDRLDGGRVSAISTDFLIYVKGGRNLKLTLPNG